MDIAAFKVLTVDAFPTSTRRGNLLRSLHDFIAELDALLMPYELWLNGSYLSEKVEPDDIDLTLVIHSHYFDKLDNFVQNAITNIHQSKSPDGYLHLFVCIQFPDCDPRVGASLYDYWASRWQVDWDNFLKGFAVVKLGER